MFDPRFADDHELLDFIRPYARETDGPPPVAFAKAFQAFGTVTDSGIARLLSDSHALFGIFSSNTRLASGPRRFDFELPGGAHCLVEIEQTRLYGQVDLPDIESVRWQTPTSSGAMENIDDGTFSLDRTPTGPFCIEIVADGQTTVTDWILSN
jgi:hypothetical protein